MVSDGRGVSEMTKRGINGRRGQAAAMRGDSAPSRRGWWTSIVPGVFAAASVMTGCSRDNIEAINLANRADQAVKVNVSGAIKDYEEATRLDPSNHRILWKLANAYHKQEEWDKMASTLARASQVAPGFANYLYNRGYALMKIAESGNKDAYQEAKQPLQDCIQKDPNYAECYHWLGTALLWTDDDQGAIQNYTKAIEL